jgi:hypothetical protein
MSNFYLDIANIWDNTLFWKENSEADYVRCIQDLITSQPFGNRKFYIFSFVKRLDDMHGYKKMYHQPRLTRPEPVPGTTLLKVDPRSPETATIIWTLPNQENFGLYSQGKAFGDPFVHECIEKYRKDPSQFMRKDPDDLSDNEIREIYRELRHNLTKKEKAPFPT